jgi:hypothetical protein
MFIPEADALPALRLVPGSVDRVPARRRAFGGARPAQTCRRHGSGAEVEMLREAAVAVERALQAAEQRVASGRDPATPGDEQRDALTRHAVRLMDIATDLPSPALRAAAMRAGADCRDVANVLYRGSAPDDVARARARLEAVRVGCAILEEQLSDALRAMLRASLYPPSDSASLVRDAPRGCDVRAPDRTDAGVR